MGTAAATLASPLPAKVGEFWTEPRATRRPIAPMVEPAHGVHIAFPVAGTRGEGRPHDATWLASPMIAVKRAERPFHAPCSAAGVIPAPRLAPPPRKVGDIMVGEKRAIPLAGTPAPSVV